MCLWKHIWKYNTTIANTNVPLETHLEVQHHNCRYKHAFGNTFGSTTLQLQIPNMHLEVQHHNCKYKHAFGNTFGKIFVEKTIYFNNNRNKNYQNK